MLRSPEAATIYAEPNRIVRIKPRKKPIHETATIGANVRMGTDVEIGPFVIIDDEAIIGDGVKIRAHAYIGAQTRIGAGSVLHTHVTVRERILIGANVTINCGSVVGSDGFGFANSAGENHKIPQVGTVEIEDNVWIGSNVTIDRATLGVTRIRRGAQIDNLAQIAHNVVIGENTVVCPQVGIAGSATIGADCLVGEKAGINGHIEIGNRVTILPFSAVAKSVPEGRTIMGAPARPVDEEESIADAARQLPEILRDVQRLKRKLNGEKR